MGDVSYIPVSMGKSQKKLIIAVETFISPDAPLSHGVAVELSIPHEMRKALPGTMTLDKAEKQGFKQADLLRVLRLSVEAATGHGGRIVGGTVIEFEGDRAAEPRLDYAVIDALEQLPPDWFSEARRKEESRRARILLKGLNPDLNERISEALKQRHPGKAIKTLIAEISGAPCRLAGQRIRTAMTERHPHDAIIDLITEAAISASAKTNSRRASL